MPRPQRVRSIETDYLLNMDAQDAQDNQDGKLLHAKLTRSIIGCAFEVINELGCGFLESVYEKAMMIALADTGLSVQSQKPVEVLFRGEPVGDFYADLLVEERVVVELKSVKTLVPEHEAQVINYLNATGIQVGLLINFGRPKLEFRRFTRSNRDTRDFRTPGAGK